MHARVSHRRDALKSLVLNYQNTRKERYRCQQASMGCGTVVFDSQYVKVGVYSSRE